MSRESMSASSAMTTSETLTLHNEAGVLTLEGKGMKLFGDFSRLLPRIKAKNLSHELLVKAARIKGSVAPTLFDATAGLGEDSFLLAAAGFTVTLCERDRVIAALLNDALKRAQDDPRLVAVAQLMTLLEGDSITELARIAQDATKLVPDVILLDPMFPAKGKAAATNKKLQFIRQLESPAQDEEALVMAALQVHPKKIVIKRPAKGPFLAGIKPSYSLSGKAVRYDCLVPANMAIPTGSK